MHIVTVRETGKAPLWPTHAVDVDGVEVGIGWLGECNALAWELQARPLAAEDLAILGISSHASAQRWAVRIRDLGTDRACVAAADYRYAPRGGELVLVPFAEARREALTARDRLARAMRELGYRVRRYATRDMGDPVFVVQVWS